MAYRMGESKFPPLRVDFDRRLNQKFHGGRLTPDAGLLAYRELDDGLGLTDLGGAALSDLHRGKNTRHLLTGLLRQSVFEHLAGCEDVNDAERLSHDPATRAVVDRKDLDRRALRPGNVHSADGWREVLEPVMARSVLRQDKCVPRGSKCALTVRNGHEAGFPVSRSARSRPDHGLS